MAFVYASLIQTYFPPDQQTNGICIATHEFDPNQAGYPQSCVRSEGFIACGAVTAQATSYGIFGLLDVCWDPGINPDSPFTAEQWAARMDPEVNTWMASIIWSRHGWRAWTTCDACNICGVTGGPIPFPRGPLGASIPPATSPSIGVLLGLLGVASGLGYLGYREHRGRP